MNTAPTSELDAFAVQHRLQGLSELSLRAIQDQSQGYTIGKGQRFLAFQKRIKRELLNHQVITHNRYSAWFRRGGLSIHQVRAFIVQFSVFSNQFLVAQLFKMIILNTK